MQVDHVWISAPQLRNGVAIALAVARTKLPPQLWWLHHLLRRSDAPAVRSGVRISPSQLLLHQVQVLHLLMLPPRIYSFFCIAGAQCREIQCLPLKFTQFMDGRELREAILREHWWRGDDSMKDV
jgi:hypothetical protein